MALFENKKFYISRLYSKKFSANDACVSEYIETYKNVYFYKELSMYVAKISNMYIL